jgi:hypothetical protein
MQYGLQKIHNYCQRSNHDDRLLPHSCYSGHVTSLALFTTLLCSILSYTVNVEAQNNFVEEVFLLYRIE